MIPTLLYACKITFAVFTFLLLTSFGCSESVNEKMVATDAAPAPAAGVKFAQPQNMAEESIAPGSEPASLDVSVKKIIKDGSITLKSKNLTADKALLDSIVKRHKGYYETEDFQNYDYSVSYNLRTRLPAANFEKCITDIENSKIEVTAKNTQNRDVTEEYIDIEGRLSSKKAYLAKYRELLARAKSIADILEIQEKVRVITEEIESYEGRKKYLLSQVNYSTLAIYISQNKDYEYKPIEQDSFWERIKSALNSGWVLFIDLILGIVGLWPLVLLVPVVVWAVKRFRNRKKNR